MAAKHTPGPWVTAPVVGVYWVAYAITSGDKIVGYVQTAPDVSDANAALIAAAPEILAMLEKLQSVEDQDGRDLCPMCWHRSGFGHAPNCALAALLKKAGV